MHQMDMPMDYYVWVQSWNAIKDTRQSQLTLPS